MCLSDVKKANERLHNELLMMLHFALDVSELALQNDWNLTSAIDYGERAS